MIRKKLNKRYAILAIRKDKPGGDLAWAKIAARRTEAARHECGKFLYSSRSEAKRALDAAISSHRFPGREIMSVYFCDKCNAWHMGHNKFLDPSRPRYGRVVDAPQV